MYLKVEDTLLDKDDDIEESDSSPEDESSKEKEETLRASFKMQYETQQDFRLTLTAASSLAVSSGKGEDSMWATI